MRSRTGKSISSRASHRATAGCLAIFFGVFGAIGLTCLIATYRGALNGPQWSGYLVSGAFVLVGLGGAGFAARRMFAPPGVVPVSTVRIPDPDDAAVGPITLSSDVSRLARLAVFAVVAIFWNGITSVFVTIVVRSHVQGDPEWFLTFFIIPFVLVGLGMIVAVVYQALAVFNPRVRIRVESGAVRVGDRVALSWAIDGRAHRLRSLRIDLIGREEATYRRGTDTYTDTHDFAELPVFASSGAVERSGEHTLEIPDDVMHSFEADNNRIKWIMRVQGDVPRWPDVADEFRMDVAPRRAGSV